MTIYVGNLSYQTTEEDLVSVFAEYGRVRRVQLPIDHKTTRIHGFAFVEMSSEAEEQAAVDALDGSEWRGRDLKVDKVKPRESSIAWSSGNTTVISGSPSAESQSEPQKSSLGSDKWVESNGLEVASGASQETDFPKQQTESTGSELKIVLKGSLEDISKTDLVILVDRLRKLSGDSSLSIIHVEQGSIVLKLSGSEDGFRVLKDLWETKQISRLIGLPVESIEYEADSSETCEDFSTSTSSSQKNESDEKVISEGTINYVFDRCTVHQNNQTALSSPITQIENQGNYMPENYVNNLQGANVANMANTVRENARQQANQHIHVSEQSKTLAESASEIQELLKSLEKINPSATETEKISYVNDKTTSNFKSRLAGALQAGGASAIEEFLDNPYVNVGKAVVKGWMGPE